MNHINRNSKPISRKPSSIRSPGINVTPTTSRASRFASKSDLLAKFQEEEGAYEDDDMFECDSFDDLPIDNEFKTLRITPDDMETLRLKQDQQTNNHNRILQFQDEDGDDLGFEDDFGGNDLQLNYRTTLTREPETELKLSPGTISTSSPKPRMRSKSLSEYSEDTNETDITSQFNDEDFDNLNDVDNIFGNEESGIYSSGGRANTSKANRHLLMKQRKLQNDAEIEEQELLKKYKRLANEETNTLRLKDFSFYDNNPIDSDALENEKTVDYEYTKDDFENFEDGFDIDGQAKLDFNKLKQYGRDNSRSISVKASMPNFNNKNNMSKVKKFKSTMDLVNELETPHPVFNNNNKIIRKLDRIPSFYSKENIKSKKIQLNHDIELEKQQLLNKYMEITEKQNRINNRHRKKNLSMKTQPSGKNKRIGLVRYLNDDPIPQNDINSKMKYNPIHKKWEGNDIDLVKFENLNVPKPLLISFNEFKSNMKDKNIQGNMVYDPDKLKWINLNKEEDKNNIFQGLPDLPDLQVNKRTMSSSPSKAIERGVSAFTQRTESTNSTNSNNADVDEFEMSPKLIEKFLKEEMKLQRKLNYWFQQPDYELENDEFNNNYFWEIRKMVIDNEE